MDLIYIKIALGIIAFIAIVRFLFTSSEEESEVDAKELRHEISEFQRTMSKKDRIPTKEEGELMDSVVKEYYQSKRSDKRPKH